MAHEHETISDAERDLRTAALNSSSTIKLLAQVRDLLAASNPKPVSSGFKGGGDFLAAVQQARRFSIADTRLMVTAVTQPGKEGVAADGGYAVPDDYRDEILTPVLGSGSLLSAFDPMITTSGLVRLAVDETSDWSTTGVQADLIAEGAASPTSKGVLQERAFTMHKVVALLSASEELLNDSPGYQRYVWKQMGRKIADSVESLVLAGTGINEPLGVLKGPGVVVVSGSGAASGTIPADHVKRMAARLLPGSYPNAIWVAHSTALFQLFGLGAGIYNPDAPSPFGYGRLLGRPVVVSEHANPVGQQGDLALTDPRGHFVGLKGPDQKTSIHFVFDQELSTFRATVRVGCVPLLSAPVARRTGTDTLGHTVVLGARP